MAIAFNGRLVDEREVAVGLIGCGSHSFRNVLSTFQFAPVRLDAVCDLDRDKAAAYARQFGAARVYDDHRAMLAQGDLDAVFIVTGYDQRGRPQYPELAIACLEAGCHVWIEKPPAASCADIERMQPAAARAGRQVMVGMKKMFAPANTKARELMLESDFGGAQLVTVQYPQSIPTVDEMQRYLAGQRVDVVVGFLDHLCHPMSLLVELLGMPRTLHYVRSEHGAGLASFTFDNGAVGSLALTHGASPNGGLERTMIVGRRGRSIVVENNTRVRDERGPAADPGTGYGTTPNFFTGPAHETTALWEPEFSLGQLYNKGLFLLGYWSEVNTFARAVLTGQALERGTLEQAWQVTRVFEAFAEGPGRTIELMGGAEPRSPVV